ncbi:hypothetical protein ACFWZ4_05560 [Frateuria sp. GZRe12]|uniref:hypothetical protein n=1 Tax=Frateuria sp. GZRe12 TaxID=3351533 RepID=UPI003EDC3FFD
MPVHAFGLLPAKPWTGGLADTWRPGEAGAQEELELFVDDALGDYARGRDLPARHGTSRLSPHLHFGEITPRQILHVITECIARMHSDCRPDPEPYLRELGWREFAHHLLYHFPHTPEAPFDRRFDRFGWCEDGSAWPAGSRDAPVCHWSMPAWCLINWRPTTNLSRRGRSSHAPASSVRAL